MYDSTCRLRTRHWIWAVMQKRIVRQQLCCGCQMWENVHRSRTTTQSANNHGEMHLTLALVSGVARCRLRHHRAAGPQPDAV